MKVLFAPSIAWNMDQPVVGAQDGPDKHKLYALLRDEGIECRFMDPTRGRWNPFAGKDTFLQSIDPVRALQIALFHRDVDVVVSVFEGAATSLAILRPFLRPRFKLALWDIGLTNWRLRNRIIDFTLPRIDQLLVLGSNQIAYVAQHHAPCPSVRAIGHYVDTEFFTRQTANQLGYVLSVGDDVGRDFPTFIEAVRHLERPVLIKSSMFRSDNLPAHVEIRSERIAYNKLLDLYAGSSIVVITSQLTGNACGVSAILEAAACGRPVIVTDNPGIRDFVVPDQTCILVPPNDPAAVDAAIRRLLQDTVLYQRLADNARSFVEQRCSVASFAKSMSSALHAMAGRG